MTVLCHLLCEKYFLYCKPEIHPPAIRLLPYLTVSGYNFPSGEPVASSSINFTNFIRYSFSFFAKFDCKLDKCRYEDCTTIKY